MGVEKRWCAGTIHSVDSCRLCNSYRLRKNAASSCDRPMGFLREACRPNASLDGRRPAGEYLFRGHVSTVELARKISLQPYARS